jgi:hypothetical protein
LTQNALRSIVEQHAPVVFGTRYSLKLEWLVVEQSHGSTSPTWQLCLQCDALEETTTAPTKMRILVPLTQLSDIPASLDRALHQQLVENAGATPERGWTMTRPRWAGALRRRIDVLRMVRRYQA